MIAAIVIVVLIALAILGLSRLSNVKKSGGTSLRRTAASHINANGSPKRGYVSMEAARTAANEQTTKSQQSMSAYKCSSCKLYHIGHA